LASSISYQALSCSLHSLVADCPLIPNCEPSFSVGFKPNVLYYTTVTSSAKKILVVSKEFALHIKLPHLWISLLFLNIICHYGVFIQFLLLLGTVIHCCKW